jgi:DDE family transposase
VVKSIGSELRERVRAARASGPESVWRAGARPKRLVVDIDATLLTAHSEKEQAAGNWGGFGCHPLLCFLDGMDEGLAGILRPGNAGSNTAQDRERVLIEALESCPSTRTRPAPRFTSCCATEPVPVKSPSFEVKRQASARVAASPTAGNVELPSFELAKALAVDGRIGKCRGGIAGASAATRLNNR